jgi:hypothetical protein
MILPHDARLSQFVRTCGTMLVALVASGGCGPEPADAPPEVPVAPAINLGEPPDALPDPAESSASAAPGGNAGADAAAASPDGSAASREETIAGIRFQIPADWKRVELSPRQQGFIDARFEVPAGDTTLQLTCSSTGGGRQANIDRWIGQFRRPEGEQPQTETLKIDGAEATWVDLAGTFDSGMPGSAGPQENWRMLGVAIAAGPQDFYLKLTGPQDAVAEVHDEFRAFAKSARLP